jgi:glycosyltransferase involved in cell wall biosynthesis
MKSVTHVITTIERGGAENQLLILVQAQTRTGREVSVAFLKGEPELKQALLDAGAKVIDNLYGKNPIRQIFLLRSILKLNGNQILHCHLPRAELITTFANRKLGFPLVISRHNAESFFPGAPSFLARQLSRYVTSKARSCIAISSAVQNFLFENEEIDKKCSIRVIYYGYPVVSNYPPSRDLDENKKVIGTISRLVPQKDIPTLLRAFSRLTDRPDYELLIVGDGRLENTLMDLANDLSLENVIWRGRVVDVQAELSRMDVFVLSSLYEGFGLVLLEAMSAGVPIVAARNSAILEVLGADYPFLFETGNDAELQRMITDLLNFNGSQAVEFGFKRLQLFSTDRMIAELNQVYALSEDYV